MDVPPGVFASAIRGIIFLIPIYRGSAVLKGAVPGILPWLSSILVVLPYRMGAGFPGLDLGVGTSAWALFFGAVRGVTGTLFLSVPVAMPSRDNQSNVAATALPR